MIRCNLGFFYKQFVHNIAALMIYQFAPISRKAENLWRKQ